MTRGNRILVAVLAVSAWVPAVWAQPAGTLAARLAEMRAEVEELSAELSRLEEETSTELRSLARQKSELELELEREKVRAAKLRSTLESRRQTIEERSTDGEDLAPILEAGLAGLRRHVASGLPFRVADRLAELAAIEDQRRSGVLSYERALIRLWGFVEDELRMTRESGMFRQTITLGNRELLAEVVRVGMAMIYFRTQDGIVGHSEKTPGGWRFTRLSDRDQQRRIGELFESFHKQIRVGLFRVPNALPELEKK